MTAINGVNLGFLTVLQEGSSYMGGYLVVNTWGRPLEFRLSSAVQPGKVQQILYASTLRPYICGELIGKTLVEKTGVAVQMVLTDVDAALELRRHVEFPVVRPLDGGDLLEAHPTRPDDVRAARDLLERLEGRIDLSEPFARIREAVSEARRMGATPRAA